ncbi:hypothetical protein ART_3990 [Arthrobacter sp. PAMC 25486]|nr:hypothetical protein ART_3990 [Arthrobacter sp. PAMC 25486]
MAVHGFLPYRFRNFPASMTPNMRQAGSVDHSNPRPRGPVNFAKGGACTPERHCWPTVC